MMKKLEKYKNKIKNIGIATSTFFSMLVVKMMCSPVLAAPVTKGQSVVTGEEAKTVGENITGAIQAISFPIGSALIFLCIVLSAIRIIATHYNPNARSEALRSILWIAIGALILGSAFIIAGVFVKVSNM